MASKSGHLGASGEKEFLRLAFGEENWEGAYDLGVKAVVVHGDPDKPGIYVIRLKWPPRVMSMPHTHPEDRHVVVLSGVWYTGTGETFDPDTAIPIKPGGYMVHPAGEVHWDGSKDEETVIHLTAYGPSDIDFVDPDGPEFSRV
jgi:quercetin dioxygenase-like cupin family protein